MTVDDLVPVTLDCRCPDQPHEYDTVYLRPRLGLAAGIAVQKLIVDANSADVPIEAAALTGVLAEAYLIHGVAAWTFQNAAGLIPVDVSTIRRYLLDDFARAEPVADIADKLYMGPVIAPLVQRAAISSPSTSTSGSTSARGNGARKPRKPSKRSSTSTTPTAGTATTSKSRAGVSSS